MLYIRLKKFVSISNLMRFILTVNDFEFVNAFFFLHLLRWLWSFSFMLLIQWITLISFLMLNQTYIPGITSTWYSKSFCFVWTLYRVQIYLLKINYLKNWNVYTWAFILRKNWTNAQICVCTRMFIVEFLKIIIKRCKQPKYPPLRKINLYLDIWIGISH